MSFVAANTHGRAAMDGADILVTATSAQAPLLKASWMKSMAPAYESVNHQYRATFFIGFTDLHTRVYEGIMEGNGYGSLAFGSKARERFHKTRLINRLGRRLDLFLPVYQRALYMLYCLHLTA